MRIICALLAALAALAIAGCGGGSSAGGSATSRLPSTSEPFRFLPPGVTFTYTGTADVNESGATRTVPASAVITIGPPGFTDPRTATPVFLYTETFTIEGIETLLYRDFFFSQPQNAFVAHGSEVFGVATFDFQPAILLPAQLVVGQSFGQQVEPYQTLIVRLRESKVVRADRITVAGAIVDTFEMVREREIPFSITTSRQFDERLWFAPGIAGPAPIKQEIRYAHKGAVVRLKLEMVGIPTLP
ncbi:MAG: hypothetical protein HYX78_14675 [Armatimonadetes bacterium]|nr:hypothetical protein [Armatimonadota bacterium]